MPLTLAHAKQQVTAFAKSTGATLLAAEGLTAGADSAGKVYEAWVLAKVLTQLQNVEHFTSVLVGGTVLRLKSAPGPINRAYPRFELRKNGNIEAEVWTDVEVSTLSAANRSGPASTADFHELDIVVCTSGQNGRPPHDELWLGVECKHTTYEKRMLREILGVRRELSYLHVPTATRFTQWPAPTVPAQPSSCLLVCSIDRDVVRYTSVGDFFGITFEHLPM